jgi:hypothetical protein
MKSDLVIYEPPKRVASLTTWQDEGQYCFKLVLSNGDNAHWAGTPADLFRKLSSLD